MYYNAVIIAWESLIATIFFKKKVSVGKQDYLTALDVRNRFLIALDINCR